MAYRQQPTNPLHDNTYANNFDMPTRNPQSRGGYSVAPVSSYLPPTVRSPSPPSPDENTGLPHLNSYHQFQAQRQQDLRSVSPQLGQRRMSAYRLQRQAAAIDGQTQTSYSPTKQRRDQYDRIVMGDAPLEIPPPPAHTSLDYHQLQLDGSEHSQNLMADLGDADGLGEKAGLHYGGTGRVPSPYRDDASYRSSSPHMNSNNIPSYQEQNHLSATQDHRLYQQSNSSRTGLTAAAAAPGMIDMTRRGSNPHSIAGRGPSPIRSVYGYSADRFSNYTKPLETPNRATFGIINPMEIAEDDDDPFAPIQSQKQGATAGGTIFRGFGGRDGAGSYGQLGANGLGSPEKSAWLTRQTSGRKCLKWLVGVSIVLIIILGVAGGVIGPLFSKKSSSSLSDTSDDGTTLTKSSPAITALLNNKNLHKVFPGIDYTPYNAQYPACLTNPPTQNNVTKDVAVLSQLAPTIRLYGTDCNQTELVLQALDLLDLKSSIKVYIGVWLSANTTTNTRQLDQMYQVFSDYGTDNIAGALIGNEVLFREDMTQAELISTITSVKSNFTSLGYTSVKVGTADLGSLWTATLADAVDIVAANVHPFFAGVDVADAANWTYSYWETNDVAVTTGLSGTKMNVIAETGWPTDGGYYEGSKAGVTEMNTFLSGWVCDALTNGTEYWWFEAFDEPWKAIYNDASTTVTDGYIEPHWGLMDADRNLKTGLLIPDCDGKTATG